MRGEKYKGKTAQSAYMSIKKNSVFFIPDSQPCLMRQISKLHLAAAQHGVRPIPTDMVHTLSRKLKGFDSKLLLRKYAFSGPFLQSFFSFLSASV
jgi:hypothetical protein